MDDKNDEAHEARPQRLRGNWTTLHHASWALLLPLGFFAGCLSSKNATTPINGGDGGLVAQREAGIDLGDAGDAGPDALPPDTFAWAHAFTAGEGSVVTAAASDATGVVIVGAITSSATFGSTTLGGDDAGSSLGHAFVAKLDASGNGVWAKMATGAQTVFEAVVIDASGNVIVSGDSYGTALTSTFDGMTFAPNTTSGVIGTSNVGAPCGILAKLDGATGALVWGKMIETTQEVDVGSIALSGANIVVAGALDGNAAFGPNETLTVTGCPANGCVYLAAFDASGTPQWAKQAASTPARNNAGAIPREVWAATDSSGDIVLAIAGGTEAAEQQSDANQLVVNEYDATGTLRWAKSTPMPAGTGTNVDGLVVTSSGDVFVLGDSGQGLAFGATTIDPNGDGEYVVRYAATGDVAWAVPWSPENGGVMSLAQGAQSLYTFGNADDDHGILPDTVVSMAVGELNPDSGAPTANVVCGIAQAIGKAVTISGTSVYVAGEGTSPGVFGRLSTTNAGLFVAKLK